MNTSETHLIERATEILAGRDPKTVTQGQMVDALLQAHDEHQTFIASAINDVSTGTERGQAIVHTVMTAAYHRLRAA
jgi:alpha-D-ribose 1-methylphosphonate 5-triphosphate synthase subunit PhnG